MNIKKICTTDGQTLINGQGTCCSNLGVDLDNNCLSTEAVNARNQGAKSMQSTRNGNVERFRFI